MVARIVVIDDEAEMLKTISGILEKSGHEIVCFAVARDGLDSLKAAPVALLITDIMMPDMDGIAVVREMGRDHPTIPVIAMTGGGRIKSGELLRYAKLLGAEDVLSKPFRPEDLTDAVEKALRGR